MRARIPLALSASIAIALGGAAHADIHSVVIGSDGYDPGSGGILNLSTTVECPEGSIAVGGATSVTDANFLTMKRSSPIFDGTALSNRPDGIGPAPNAWSGLATLSQAMDGPLVKVGVLCATGVQLQSVVTSAEIPIGETGTATATCPEGSSAISAGIGAIGAGGSILDFEPTFDGTSLAEIPNGVGPAPSGWTATTLNDGFLPTTLKLAALCLSGRSVTTAITGAVATFQSVGLGLVECAEGEIATAGGHARPEGAALTLVGHEPMIGGSSLASLADGTAAVPNGWASYVRNAATTAFFPYAAVCVPEPDAATASITALFALVGRARALRR